MTLLSVSYLVYDRVYETDATVSAPISDPDFPFTFPFMITNNSHVFAIRNIGWQCRTIFLSWDKINELKNGASIIGSSISIAPGQNLNFDCSSIGPTSRLLRTPNKVEVNAVTMQIEISYQVDFFGVFLLSRRPQPTKFTVAAQLPQRAGVCAVMREAA